jgi:hypothetical protein
LSFISEEIVKIRGGRGRAEAHLITAAARDGSGGFN